MLEADEIDPSAPAEYPETGSASIDPGKTTPAVIAPDGRLRDLALSPLCHRPGARLSFSCVSGVGQPLIELGCQENSFAPLPQPAAPQGYDGGGPT